MYFIIWKKEVLAQKWLYFAKTLKLLPKIQKFAQMPEVSFHKTQNLNIVSRFFSKCSQIEAKMPFLML